MQELERMIKIYHAAYIVFLVLTIVFLLLTIFMFFKFDIRRIIDMKTGRGAKRSIQKMEEINARTGKLRQNMTAHTAPKLRPEDRITHPVTAQNQQVQNAGNAQAAYRDANSTGQLAYTGGQETTILNDTSETTLLYQNAGDTAPETIAKGRPERKKPPGAFKIEKEILWVHTKEVL